MTTWNVMLVDHDRLFSAALATLIGGGPFRVSAHAASAATAILVQLSLTSFLLSLSVLVGR